MAHIDPTLREDFAHLVLEDGGVRINAAVYPIVLDERVIISGRSRDFHRPSFLRSTLRDCPMRRISAADFELRAAALSGRVELVPSRGQKADTKTAVPRVPLSPRAAPVGLRGKSGC